ncbi:hypothetical protein NE237_010729 [Protea cynaroides]|uniref:Uncharacterized protein n=1 Tax=Protea cynaroides TaxID=273540 RepID=A0A9Q0R1V0_9MAGN|nr:hypothetical protein NE237_010729 [Protea cynaroides]
MGVIIVGQQWDEEAERVRVEKKERERMIIIIHCQVVRLTYKGVALDDGLKDYVERWHLCQPLEVLEYKEVPWPNAVIEEKFSVDACEWPSKDVVIGDSMYMPAAFAEKAHLGINPFGKYKNDYTSENDKVKAIEEWIVQHGKESNIAIGLQAWQISCDDGKHYYEAGSPWWR